MSEKKVGNSARYDKDRCKRCSICVDICPKNCLALKEEGIVQGEGCIFCKMCELSCPEFAIRIEGKK